MSCGGSAASRSRVSCASYQSRIDDHQDGSFKVLVFALTVPVEAGSEITFTLPDDASGFPEYDSLIYSYTQEDRFFALLTRQHLAHTGVYVMPHGILETSRFGGSGDRMEHARRVFDTVTHFVNRTFRAMTEEQKNALVRDLVVGM